MAKKKKISKAERRKIAIAQEAIKARDKMEQEMLNNEMYIISVNEEGTPFLVNDQYVLLYFRKELADEATQGFSKIYGEGKIHTYKIDDNMRFFEMMWFYGMPEFIINGDSNIYNIGAFFQLSKKPKNPSKGLEIRNQQPVRTKKTLLSKKIEIKEWFSIFSTISLVCALCFWITTIVFGRIINPGKEYAFLLTTLTLIFMLGGILSGVVAVNGAHKKRFKGEAKASWGIALIIIGLFALMVLQ